MGAVFSGLDRVLAWGLCAGVWVYRCTLGAVFHAMGAGQCRFRPTCSAYAIEALRVHGGVKGFGLAVRRLSRCHPFSRCETYDPVPVRDDDDGAGASDRGA